MGTNMAIHLAKKVSVGLDPLFVPNTPSTRNIQGI